MAYIGNIPAESYASFETETFSVSATTNYTLSHAVTNENEIRLVINGVVQQPGSGKAYTASGTTLTLSSATVSGDVMYAVYLGRALQTVNPPNSSVGTAQLGSDAVTGAKIADDAISDEHLDPTAITGQTAETSIATDDLILLSDTSASGALKKMTRANFVSGVGGTNTPSFHASMTSNTNFADAATVNCVFNSEGFDSDSKYNTSDGLFTPTVSGRYFLYSLLQFDSGNELEGTGGATLHIRKNGSVIAYYNWKGTSGSFDTRGIYYVGVTTTSDTNDYFNVTFRQDTGNTWSVYEGAATAYFGGFKLIT